MGRSHEVRVHQRILIQLASHAVKVRGQRIYAPAVLVKPGVLNGVLVDEEVLRESAAMWGGRPVTINHPAVAGVHTMAGADEQTWDRHVAGVLLHVRYDRGLKGMMVLDQGPMTRVGKPAQRVYRALRAGQAFEVSTGYWAEIDFSRRGVHNGKAYMGVTERIYPDHVAILPDVEGACSWRDGCGMPRTNAQGCGCGLPPAAGAEQQEARMDEQETTVQVDAKHVDLTTLSLANEGVNSVGTVPETDTPQDATAMTVAAPAPEGHPLPEDAGQADAAEWTAWDAWEGSQSAAGDGNAPPSEEEAATEATPEPAAAETDPVVANAAPLAGMAVPVEGQPMPRNAPAAAGREEEALLAAVAELGSVPAVTALLQTLVAQRSQARQNHVAAIVANSRGQLRAADVDGLPDATLERIARALTPQSYAGAAQPATVMESEWVEYVMPQVGGN